MLQKKKPRIDKDKLTPKRVGYKWGFVDRKGNFVIEPSFDFPFFFDKGYACIRKNGLGWVKYKKNWYRINKKKGFLLKKVDGIK